MPLYSVRDSVGTDFHSYRTNSFEASSPVEYKHDAFAEVDAVNDGGGDFT